MASQHGEVSTINYRVQSKKMKIMLFGKTGIPLERSCQEEQNGANFSFIAPSTLE